MFSGPFLKTAISFGIGLGLGAADYYFFVLGARFLTTKLSGKFPLAFIVSEMVRLISLLGIILVLSLQRKSISFWWLIIGPVMFAFIKYFFLFRKLAKL